MNKLDVKRIITVHDKFKSSIPIEKTGDTRCTQSIFIDRYFRFLKNRTFKIKLKGEIYYAMFCQQSFKVNSWSTNNSFMYFNYGVKKHLGYNGHEFNISFINEKGVFTILEKIHYNDFLELEYEEITRDEFYKIVKLFR